MSWWQLSIHCNKGELSQTENILLELGAQSLTIGDAADEPIYEPLPGETPLWPDLIITALYDQSHTLEALYDELVKHLTANQISSIRKQTLEDQIWERAYLDQFKPLKFGKNLWVCPSWHQPPDSEACNIILDPGIAFGTGTHPTTALCLEFLDHNPPLNKSVLDYGCGSGILAIAAYKLGASLVSCIDIDPQAIEATRNNAQRNNISPGQLNISLPGRQKLERVEYLMANILSGPLIDLEPMFAKITAPGGQILLSGILQNQVEALINAYRLHFTLDTVRILDDWCRITGIRN